MSGLDDGTGNEASEINKSKTTRAGVQFPLGRIDNFLRNGIHYRAKRIGVEAPVFMAAVAEYLVTEVLELAGNVARHDKRTKRTRIAPTHIHVAIRNDEELGKLLSKIIIAQGGNGVLSNSSTI